MIDALFLVKTTCIYCENVFQTPRVRSSFKRKSGTDSDFCSNYKEVNPDYYVVHICPLCGFASTESFSKAMNEDQRMEFKEKLGVYWTKSDYSSERSWHVAMYAFKRALLCAQIKKEKPRIIAGILHHIAWLYRHKKDQTQEKRFLQFALEAYISIYESDKAELNKARLMYIIGELSRRLQYYSEAVRWFSRVINDESIVDAGMIRACREQWAQTRDDMKAV